MRECYICGRDHQGKLCPKFNGCFNYGKGGHLARDCPEKKGVSKSTKEEEGNHRPTTEGRVFNLIKRIIRHLTIWFQASLCLFSTFVILFYFNSMHTCTLLVVDNCVAI